MRHHLATSAILSALLTSTANLHAGPPPLIPREVLFGNPDRASPRLSPDGRYLAYLAPHNGVMNIWVRDVKVDNARPLSEYRKHDISKFAWAENDRQILFMQDVADDDGRHLLGVDIQTSQIRDLTPFKGIRAQLIAVRRSLPNKALVAINNRDPKVYDVYRIDLTTGDIELDYENSAGLLAWEVDHDLNLRAAAKPTARGGFQLVIRGPKRDEWHTLRLWGPEDSINVGPVGFSSNGSSIYVLSSLETNTSELREIDLATGLGITLASNRQVDVGGVLLHPTTHEVDAVRFNKERARWKLLSRKLAGDFKIIRQVQRGDFEVVDRERSDRTWLVSFTSDDGPISYYTYNRNSRDATLLFTNRKALEGVMLARMASIGFVARDGLVIRGYLTTPPGLPARNLPTVVIAHRSPWARDQWGYDGTVQWLANRGYAVLQVNFRGSIGYGKAFVNASKREWGGRVHDDLEDGVRWAVAKGICDPTRVAIFGSSYGGYEALVAATRETDVFCCSVSVSAPVNLISFVQQLPEHLPAYGALIRDRVGHPQRDAELLESRSPAFMLDRIRHPLLVAHGLNDPLVPCTEVRSMIETLKNAKKEVTYVEYADEGHTIARSQNRLDLARRTERFLAQHLNGRYEE